MSTNKLNIHERHSKTFLKDHHMDENKSMRKWVHQS
jgi:hypothetical protein